MNSGTFGAVVLLLVGGGLYYASTNLGDYIAQRSEQGAPVMEDAVAAIDEAVAAIAPVAEDEPDSAANDTSANTAEGAVDEMAEELADDTADPSTEMALAAPATDATEIDEATAQDVEQLESLAHEMREEAAEPGTLPELDVVRVDPTGEVVIAGNAPEGDRVALLYNGETVAESDVDAGGDFVLVPEENLPAGEGTLEVVVIDENGNVSEPADEQIAVVLPEEGSQDGFLVGVLRPGEPVEIIEREMPQTDVAEAADAPAQASQEQVASANAETAPSVSSDTSATPFVVVDAIELEGQRIWIAGGALPGTIVRLYQDNALLGEALTGPEGRYLYEGELVDADGEVRIRADALAPGSAGVVARAEVPFQMPNVQLADAAPTSDTQQAGASDVQDREASVVEVASAAADGEAPQRVSVLDSGNVIIRRGDNLWRLSRRVYGLGIRYTSIYDANRDQIGDPALIFPGQVFELPSPEAEWGVVPGLEALEPDQIPPEDTLTN